MLRSDGQEAIHVYQSFFESGLLFMKRFSESKLVLSLCQAWSPKLRLSDSRRSA